ncbi:nucleoside hydrolase [Garciella nitratireducens]|uniref:nucleoside hydrolase n=1 Tax=Garciella nitratireducens TaxID=218205 RepID=UPI000DEA0378|nr:nucleoside hydrolase [Garciella nitratireducens]RBP39902.1 purine nucleosidase [Garciella nitratireducens]
MKRKKVIIDCDPGIDDSLALMLALTSPELEVLGITIAPGNVEVEKGYKNTLKTLQILNRLDIPVYKGEDKPLSRELQTAYETHGQDGLGENHYPLVKIQDREETAVDFILNTLQTTHQVSIIALGPLTNIAVALISNPEAFLNLEEFVSMGGCFKSYGNCSPVAEYNYWVDPEGAKYVYENLPTKIHMVGLDVTRKIVLTPNMMSLIHRCPSEKGKFIEEITRFYMDFHWKYEKIIGCVINDPLAVLYFIDRSICQGIDAYTTLEIHGICRGQSVVDEMNFWKKKPNTCVLTKVDQKRFFREFFSRVLNADETFLKLLEGMI